MFGQKIPFWPFHWKSFAKDFRTNTLSHLSKILPWKIFKIFFIEKLLNYSKLSEWKWIALISSDYIDSLPTISRTRFRVLKIFLGLEYLFTLFWVSILFKKINKKYLLKLSPIPIHKH